jgi:carboxylate-amine ligase
VATRGEAGSVGALNGRRTFGVEEEMLLVGRKSHRPSRGAHAAVNAYFAHRRERGAENDPSFPQLAFEVKQEQVEIVSPPATGLDALADSILRGRAIADVAASRAGATIAAMGTSAHRGRAHVVPTERFLRLAQGFGRTLEEQLTCGFHVHVAVADMEEGIAVLDRARTWLPVVLALSANSPLWHGSPTGFASYRYQAWGRWPTTGPSGVFGSAEAYRRRVASILASGVPLDEGMVYFDARYSARVPTIEVRVADVCAEAEHAATLAGIVRALVDTAAREAQQGKEPDPATVDILRVWMFQASRAGIGGELLDATTRRAVPAREAVAGLLEHIREALEGYGDTDRVAAGVESILAGGGGAARQLAVYERSGSAEEVVADVVRRTLDTGS